MPNMKALSHRIKKLWPMLKFFKSRSKIKVKVTCSKFMVPLERSCHKFCWKGLVIRYTHAKYESPISYNKLEAQGPCNGHRSIIAILNCFS